MFMLIGVVFVRFCATPSVVFNPLWCSPLGQGLVIEMIRVDDECVWAKLNKMFSVLVAEFV